MSGIYSKQPSFSFENLQERFVVGSVLVNLWLSIHNSNEKTPAQTSCKMSPLIFSMLMYLTCDVCVYQCTISYVYICICIYVFRHHKKCLKYQ